MEHSRPKPVRWRRALAGGAVLALGGFGLPALAAASAQAEGPNAIVSVDDGHGGNACLANTLPANDDGSTALVPLGFTADFFGNSYDHVYVNNNGNITFDGPQSTYTPYGIANSTTKIIAPFFADVDTRGTGSSPVTYSAGTGTYGGRAAFCVDWVNVGYYGYGTDKLNSFQLLLVDRSDAGAGDFDIYFNYDKVQWETGGASGGSDGLGGQSAAVGYSSGGGVNGHSFELPGSHVNGALLDTNQSTGLIHNSRGTTQLGRYLFNVRNGNAPLGHSISGTIHANTADGAGVGGAIISVCGTDGSCSNTVSSPDGSYAVSALPDQTYTITVSPPAGSAYNMGHAGPVIVNGADLTGEDVILTGPQPLPGNTTIPTQVGSNNGVPVVYWQSPQTINTSGCAGSTSATWTVRFGSSGGTTSGVLTESPAGSGNYTATIPAFYPNHGDAHIVLSIPCATTTTTTSFDIYIDPSGTVVDTHGNPVSGATVTLLASDTSAGPFVAVPDGSAVMDPSNRSNPSTTNAAGEYGWNVTAGFYKVRAEKAGCTAPGNASQTYVESDLLTIPPAVTGLTLTLDCPSVTDTTPPVITCPPAGTALIGSTPAQLTPATATDDVDANPVVTSNAPASLLRGVHSITWTATDAAGNHSSCIQKVRGIYDFVGFAAPISRTTTNSQTVNQSFTVKWQLKDAQGNFFSAASAVTQFNFGYVFAFQNGRWASVPLLPATSSLTYDGASNSYVLTMTAPASWAGTTKTFFLSLNDGELYTAPFKFRS